MRKPFGYVTQQGRLIRRHLLDDYVIKEAQESTTAQLREMEVGFASDGMVQPPYNPAALARHLEINTYHRRAVYTKAQDTAGLGWTIEPFKGTAPDEKQKEEAERFLDRRRPPLNETLTRFMIDRESIGWGALELVREDNRMDGKPTGIFHVPSWTVRIHADEHKFQQRRGSRRVFFRAAGYTEHDIHRWTGGEHEPGSLPVQERATELLWDTIYTPTNDYYGMPDHLPALGAIHGDLARRDYNIAFFDNYGVPAYAVFITGDFDPGEPEVDEEGKEIGPTPLEKMIEQHFSEVNRNPHSTLVMSLPAVSGGSEVKVQFERLSVETKEASFRMYRTDNKMEILSAHGVDPYRAGIAEVGSLGGTTAREASEIYKESVINPRQEMLEDLVNQHIIWGGFQLADWTFKLTEINTRDIQGEENHEMALMMRLVDRGALSPRAMYEYWAPRFEMEPDAWIPFDDEGMEQQEVQIGEGPPPGENGRREFAQDDTAQLDALHEKLISAAVKANKPHIARQLAAMKVAAHDNGHH